MTGRGMPNEVAVTCERCRGVLPIGKHRDTPRCPVCNGRGYVWVDRREAFEAARLVDEFRFVDACGKAAVAIVDAGVFG